jgi:predicted alpha/beta-fold hydrolase
MTTPLKEGNLPYMTLEPCIPPAWARGAHKQTILGHILPSPKLRTKGKRVEVPLVDGDRLVGFVQEGSSSTVVYIFHGLAGSTDSSYMHRTAILAAREGHSVVLMNHRGCGEGSGLAKWPYHSGRAEDLSAMIEHGRKMFPAKRHVAVGFSLSANALLLLLSGKRGEFQPDAAIAVNAPIQLERTAHLLKTGMNRLYDFRFFRQCRRDILAGLADPELKARIPAVATLHDFDNLYTAPAGGFADREDYYNSCSTHDLLQRIEKPTIVITSEDDPFVPFEGYKKAKLSKKVLMHAEPFGGHMGYLTREKTPLGTMRWQDYALREAMRHV